MGNLQKLVITEQEISEDTLERILSDYVLLARDTRKVLFTPDGAALTGRLKVLLILVAQHAWRFLDQNREADTSLSIKVIEAQTGLPGGTLRPILKDLKDGRLVELVRKGVYRVPPYALSFIESEMRSIRDKGQGRPRPGGKRRLRGGGSKPNVRPQLRQLLETGPLEVEGSMPVFAKAKLLDRYFLALYLVKAQRGFPGMTASEVVFVLNEPPVNLPKIHSSNVSRDLGRARRYVTPYKLGHSFEYRLTSFGEERVKNLIREGQGTDGES